MCVLVRVTSSCQLVMVYMGNEVIEKHNWFQAKVSLLSMPGGDSSKHLWGLKHPTIILLHIWTTDLKLIVCVIELYKVQTLARKKKKKNKFIAYLPFILNHFYPKAFEKSCSISNKSVLYPQCAKRLIDLCVLMSTASLDAQGNCALWPRNVAVKLSGVGGGQYDTIIDSSVWFHSGYLSLSLVWNRKFTQSWTFIPHFDVSP